MPGTLRCLAIEVSIVSLLNYTLGLPASEDRVLIARLVNLSMRSSAALCALVRNHDQLATFKIASAPCIRGRRAGPLVMPTLCWLRGGWSAAATGAAGFRIRG